MSWDPVYEIPIAIWHLDTIDNNRIRIPPFVDIATPAIVVWLLLLVMVSGGSSHTTVARTMPMMMMRLVVDVVVVVGVIIETTRGATISLCGSHSPHWDDPSLGCFSRYRWWWWWLVGRTAPR